MTDQHNAFDLTGKVVIVTGGDGFLGKSYVEGLRESGATVVNWDRGFSLQLDTLGGLGTRVTGVDVTDEDRVRGAVQYVLDTHGRIDGLVNNAAMNPAIGGTSSARMFASYDQYDIGLFRQEIDVNLVGHMITMKHVAPHMIKQGSGSVVNIASEVSVMAHDHRVYAERGKYKSPAYTASKTAVVGLTRQWSAMLGEYGVRVNALSIGGVYKEGMPEDFAERFGAANMLGRMAREGEYIPTLIYLLSNASSFMTGSNLIIDGGKHAW